MRQGIDSLFGLLLILFNMETSGGRQLMMRKDSVCSFAASSMSVRGKQASFSCQCHHVLWQENARRILGGLLGRIPNWLFV
jgi:hypothetical protein